MISVEGGDVLLRWDTDEWIEDEAMLLKERDNMKEIGKDIIHKKEAQGEFIGVIKCSVNGSRIIRNHFDRDKQLFSGKPFQRCSIFERAYLTDFLQDLLDLGVPIKETVIFGGWLEFDTVQDYLWGINRKFNKEEGKPW